MNAQDVLKVHSEHFYGALLSGDLIALSALYSDDYRLVRSDGSMLNKEQVLCDLREGGLAFTSIMLCIEDVRVFETTAMVIGESHATATRNRSSTSTKFRLVAIYEEIDAVVRLSYFQSTNLPTKSQPRTESDLIFPAMVTQRGSKGLNPSRSSDSV